MSTELLTNLKVCIKEYCDVDNELTSLNKKVYEKREDKRCITMRLTDIIKNPQFSNIDKLRIDGDGSSIKIARPGTYNKAWSLSKKELDSLLRMYFATTSLPSADECINFIVEERSKMLVGQEFDFTRTLSNGNS